MKFAAIIEHGADKERLKVTHPAHRVYLRTFIDNGQLRAAGPFSDDAGALWCWTPTARRKRNRSSRATLR